MIAKRGKLGRVMSASPRVLLTGFEPFGGAERNPSGDAVLALADTGIPGASLTTAVLPVVYGQAFEALAEHLDEGHEAIILTGMAGGRPVVRVERGAHNRDASTAPDNAGVLAKGTPIVEGAPWRYATSVPVDTLVDALTRAEVPAEASDDAGAFVCNRVLYRTLHHFEEIRQKAGAGKPVPEIGFVHVPGMDTLPLETVLRALRVAVATALGARA